MFKALFLLLASVSALHVSLIGDSLINRPCNEHDLIGKLQALVKDNQGGLISFSNDAHNGAKIKPILDNLPSVLPKKADAYVLFWDSDCSDINEDAMSASDVVELRANYTSNLIQVIKDVKSTGAFITVAGPEVLGEGPIGRPSRWSNKKTMLNQYRAINEQVCADLMVPYIDIRQAFLDAEGILGKIINLGWLTVDGEHENEAGTKIVAQKFADVLNNVWLGKTPSKMVILNELN